jgi:16S rRNA (cytosine1402-N4)-methyltransferase
MPDEVLKALAPAADGFYVDATFGRGGHSARLLERLGPDGRLLALDRDPEAIAHARTSLGQDRRFQAVQASFAQLGRVLAEHVAGRAPNGVLFDLGVSSPQLDVAERGFSFRQDGPLDMRMDPTRGEPVADWLARVSVAELRHVIADYGEERFAARVAAAIDAARRETPITRTVQLAEIVARAVRSREPGKHPATRTFQALRMQANDEPGQLRAGLAAALAVLAPAGRLVVIAFHSIEDRIVKQFLHEHSTVDPVWAGLPEIPASAQPGLKLVGRKQKASEAEIARNPRSRSAVLRCAEKLTARSAS